MADNKNDKKENIADNIKYFFQNVTGTVDHTYKFKEKEREENRSMAMLSYILPIIPYIVERHSGYVKFHSNQGMNLFVWFILLIIFIGIVDTAFPWDFVTDFLRFILIVLFFLLAAFGVYNASKGIAKEIPFASKVNLVKMVESLFGK